MQDPILLAVDDDPAALGDVERELRDRYASSYGVVVTTSPDDALATLTRLSEAGDEVPLVLAAQWLPGTIGSELLGRVRRLHPHTKRGLLVPWRAWAHPATAEAIFDSKALGRIDYYVLRPAASPDELFTRPSPASCSSGPRIVGSLRTRFTSSARTGRGGCTS